jgi:hypothetical protein
MFDPKLNRLGEKMKKESCCRGFSAKVIVGLVLVFMAGMAGGCENDGIQSTSDSIGQDQVFVSLPCEQLARPDEPTGLAEKCVSIVCENGTWATLPLDGTTCWTPTCLNGAGNDGKGVCDNFQCGIETVDGEFISVETPEEALAVEQHLADEHSGPCETPPDCFAGEKMPPIPLCADVDPIQTADGNCYCENHFALFASQCKKPLLEKLVSFTIPEKGQVVAVALEGCADDDAPSPVQMRVAVYDAGTGKVLKTAIVTTPETAVHSDFSVVPVPQFEQDEYRFEVVFVSDGRMLTWDFTWEPETDGGRFVHDSNPVAFLENKMKAVSQVRMVRIGDAEVAAFLNKGGPEQDRCVWIAQTDGKSAPVYVGCGDISQVNLALVEGNDLIVSLVYSEGEVALQRLTKKLSYEGKCSTVNDLKCDPSASVELAYCAECGADPAVYLTCNNYETGGLQVGVLQDTEGIFKVEPWHEVAPGFQPSLAIVAPSGNVYLAHGGKGSNGGGTTVYLIRIDYKLSTFLGPSKVLGELNVDRVMPRIDRVVEQGGSTIVLCGTNVHGGIAEYFSQTVNLNN